TRTRTHQTRVDDFIRAKKAHLLDITAARDAALNAMRASLKALEGGVSEHRNVADVRRRFHQAFVTHLDELDAVTNALLMSYRQKNAESRHSAAPDHFQTPVSLDRPSLEMPTDLPEEIRQLDDLVQKVAADLEKRQAALHDAYDDAL